MLTIISLVGGFVALVIGGELLVRGAISVARALNVSPLVIGLTLVGFGTSAPELVTSLQAAFLGSPGIAVGNVVGSNIANILLILGVAALLRPIAVSPDAFRRDGTVLIAATLLCVGIIVTGALGRISGGAMVLLLAAFTIGTLVVERRRTSAAGNLYAEEADIVGPLDSTGRAVGLALAGLVLTILGARFLVTGAISLAETLGMSETLIGLTIVAVGTSMPELVTSIVAARRGQSDVALGNVVGSNLFNILGILGVTALVSPLAVPPEIASLDVWVMLGATIAMLVFAMTGWRIGRREGALLLSAYVVYVGALIALA